MQDAQHMDLKLLKGLKQGPYVELNISESESDYAHWADTSLFLEEEVFGIFADCFEACAGNFNYYGPTRYSQSDLPRLREELVTSAARWTSIADSSALVAVVCKTSILGNQFLHELESDAYDLKSDWSKVLDSLKQINTDLIELLNRCSREGRTLWVLGI